MAGFERQRLADHRLADLVEAAALRGSRVGVVGPQSGIERALPGELLERGDRAREVACAPRFLGLLGQRVVAGGQARGDRGQGRRVERRGGRGRTRRRAGGRDAGRGRVGRDRLAAAGGQAALPRARSVLGATLEFVGLCEQFPARRVVGLRREPHFEAGDRRAEISGPGSGLGTRACLGRERATGRRAGMPGRCDRTADTGRGDGAGQRTREPRRAEPGIEAERRERQQRGDGRRRPQPTPPEAALVARAQPEHRCNHRGRCKDDHDGRHRPERSQTHKFRAP